MQKCRRYHKMPSVFLPLCMKEVDRIKEFCITAVMAYASAVDINRRQFPNVCQLMLIAIYFIEFNISNLWGAITAIPFFIASCKTDKMGMGDSKAVLLLGGLIGINKMLLTVIAGCIIFIVYGLAAGKRKGEKELPFIPSLTLGYITEVLIFEIFRCV